MQPNILNLDGSQIYTLKLSGQQLGVIWKGIVKVAYEEAAPVVNEITQQLSAQSIRDP